jgi:type III pantothenate kinase
MRLLIDIGNTQVKVVTHDAAFGVVTMFPLAALTTARLNTLLTSPPHIHKVVVSCVVPKCLPMIEKAAKKHKVDLYVVDPLRQRVVNINTKHPAEVGADLIATAAAVKRRTIIVDFGTATTLSLVENHTLEGVSIAPGVMTQLQSLIANTAQLDTIELQATDHLLGRDTTEAMLAGVVMGTAKMVEGVIESLGKADVIFTGGYASMIHQTLGNKYEVDPLLLMKGLLALDAD